MARLLLVRVSRRAQKVRITVKVAATKNYKAYSKSIIYKVK